METFLNGVTWLFILTGGAVWLLIGFIVLSGLWYCYCRPRDQFDRTSTQTSESEWDELSRWRQAVELHRQGKVRLALQLVGDRVFRVEPDVEEKAA